jgi:hypothetical protein
VAQKARIALTIGFATLLTVASLSAHHAFAPMFDGNKVTTLKGVVTRLEWVNPHSFIYVEVKGKDGVTEFWALEGPAATQLSRRSLTETMVKVGDVIEACGYGTKDGVNPIRTFGDASGRVLSTELLTLADGQKHIWSNYGQRKCLPADLVNNRWSSPHIAHSKA